MQHLSKVELYAAIRWDHRAAHGPNRFKPADETRLQRLSPAAD